MSDHNETLLSYASIIKDREQFVKSGGRYSSDFNKYDVPNCKYFKILFHFYNGDVNNNEINSGGSGLLHPTWLRLENLLNQDSTQVTKDGEEAKKFNNIYNYNSAYSYLLINHELERMDMLKDFIILLSNISSESPWYFKEIVGLDNALTRNVMDSIKIEEKRKNISIKCLCDSFDDRIATLMDLYRAIVWSWQTKREIIPANLRKFDMSIYIFNDPHIPFHRMNDEYANFSGNDTSYQTSYKCIEFHNCEFDYDSAKTALSSLDNSTGISPEYTIDIYFDDCYETRYNEFLMKEIGDMIKWDTTLNLDIPRDSYDKSSINKNALEERIGYYKYGKKQYYEHEGVQRKAGEKLGNNLVTEDIEKKGGFIANTVDQLLTTGVNVLGSYAKRAVLGNLYTYSLTKIGDQISTLMNGGVMETANAIAEYVTDSRQRNNKGRYSNDELLNKTNIFEGAKKPYINHAMGNIFKANTVANNI